MVDWPGLLKFSLNYCDGTQKSDFKPMEEERKKWLEEALSHYTMQEVRRIQEILEALHKPESTPPNQQQKTCRNDLLQQLEQLIQSLDRGDTLYQLGGHMVILNIVFNSKYLENRIIAARVFCYANQNDAKVQDESINVGAFEFLERLKTEPELKIREAVMSCLSSLIRGENLEAKRIFIKLKGLEEVKRQLQLKESIKIKTKCMNILKDLIYYDDKLHKTFNDLTSFTNTNSLKNQGKGLLYDKNKEVQNNELEENKMFRGCIKKWLAENPQLEKEYNIWLKEQES